MSSNRKTWLITGASSGLGLSIALAALRSGDRVILAARGVEKAAREHPEIEELGGIWLKLDLKSADTEHVVANAIKESGGKLDVVVNNAGTMVLTSLEDARMEDVHDMMETHVYGTIRVMKGVLPTMRAQKSGTVLNMSSFSGVIGLPGVGLYTLCKFALEGISESYEAELAPFGIRVAIIEPGAFKTEIFQKATAPSLEGVGSHYLESAVGNTFEVVTNSARDPEQYVAGDPAKLAQRIVEIVNGSGLAKGMDNVLRFPLGKDSRQLIKPKITRMLEDFDKTQALAESTGFDGYQGIGATDNLSNQSRE